jgi:hypothetical protein
VNSGFIEVTCAIGVEAFRNRRDWEGIKDFDVECTRRTFTTICAAIQTRDLQSAVPNIAIADAALPVAIRARTCHPQIKKKKKMALIRGIQINDHGVNQKLA